MSKKLKRTSTGDVVLPSGELITVKEQKALRSAVNSANRIRKRLIDELPDVAKEKYRDFGQKNEFFIRKKSKSLSRFENKSQYEAYLKGVRHITSGDYVRIALETRYENYLKALSNTFGSKATPVIMALAKLTPKQLKAFIDKEELHGINYVYYESEVDVDARLEVIMADVAAISRK